MPSKKKKKSAGPRVAMHLPPEVHALYQHCAASWAKIKADPVHFASPYPPAAEVDGDLAELADIIQKAEGGDPVWISARNSAELKVRQTFELLGKYVQSVARSGPAEDAVALINGVLMYVSKVGQRPPKPPLEARHAAISGEVLLIALAIADTLVYYWELSGDQQQTWTAATQTGEARATISGLTPGKMYWFRVRAFVRGNVTTDWVHPVSLIIT